LVTTVEVDVEDAVDEAVDGDVGGAIDELVETTYALYDVNGDLIAETDEESAPAAFSNDYLIFDYALYEIGAEGVLTKTADIPEYMTLGTCHEVTDKYFYIVNDDMVAVYDHEFMLTATYVVPSYVEDYEINVLNGGDILVQYLNKLDEDAKKFDIIGEDGEKLDLVSLLISAKNGRVKELKLDVVIANVMANSYLFDTNKADEDNYFTNKFDNIARVYPIEDQKINESDAAMDLVILNDNGKLGGSLKLTENQAAEWPERISNKLFIVELIDGSIAIVNAKGKIQKVMNNELHNVGAFFYGDRAVYDLELNSVYDLVKKDAEYYGQIGNTLLIKENNDDGYNILAFREAGADPEKIYTYDATSEIAKDFSIVDGIGYLIHNLESGDYEYYNAAGDKIVTTTYPLEVVAVGNDGFALLKGTSEGETTYHAFTIGG